MTSGCNRLISCADPKREHKCLLSLFCFMPIWCIFISLIDIVLFDLYWTVYGIYGPMFFIFLFGLWAYLNRHQNALLAFLIILPLEMIATIGLAIYLFANGTVWGILAIIIDYVIAWIWFGAWMLYKQLKNAPDENEQDQQSEV